MYMYMYMYMYFKVVHQITYRLPHHRSWHTWAVRARWSHSRCAPRHRPYTFWSEGCYSEQSYSIS